MKNKTKKRILKFIDKKSVLNFIITSIIFWSVQFILFVLLPSDYLFIPSHIETCSPPALCMRIVDTQINTSRFIVFELLAIGLPIIFSKLLFRDNEILKETFRFVIIQILILLIFFTGVLVVYVFSSVFDPVPLV